LRKQCTDPAIQVHQSDRHTLILRVSKAVSFEAPFVFLLFGNERAVLFDTGPSADPAKIPLRRTVDELVDAWLADHPRDDYELVVAHTHGHHDHRDGDPQFAEGGNQQLKTYLRGPGRVLRSGSPDLVKQEIWGYLLTHYAISALTCTAATAVGIDPDRVKFKRTARILRRRVADPAFPLSTLRPSWPRSRPTSRGKAPQPPAQAPHLPPRHQARTPQRLPRQETRRQEHPARRPRNDPPRQPGPHQHRSMIKIS
jgi:hypothetical protein